MKKLLFILGLFISVSTFAQNTHVYPSVKASHILVGGTAGLAVDTPLILDMNAMQMIDRYIPGIGFAASDTVTHYSYTNIGPIANAANNGTGNWTGFGWQAWLSNSTSGGWIKAIIPHGVIIGNSIVAGHTNPPIRTSGLEQNNMNIQDSASQIGYYLTRYCNMPVENMGIGGQTTPQIRARFRRDVLGIADIVGDGKTLPTTLSRAAFCIIEGGVNDAFQTIPIPLATVQANILWMVEQCQQYQIPCIVLNSVGQGASAPVYSLAEVDSLNTWEATGDLQKYGAVVVDINSFWNSGVDGGVNAYNNNNFHPSSFVNTGDFIHFTPVGYDSVAQIIIRHAKLPVLDKIIFQSVLDPVNPPANYNRPTGITISGSAFFGTASQSFTASYTLPNNANDTILITSPILTDTAKITITSSTGSGSVSGWTNITYHITNNPTHQLWYTIRPPVSGANVGDIVGTSINITPQTTATQAVLQINQSWGATPGYGLLVNVGAGSTQMFLNGFANTTPINSSILNVYGGGIGTTGQLFSSSTLGSQFNNWVFGANTAAAGTGYGLGTYGSSVHLNPSSSATLAGSIVTIDAASPTGYVYNTATSNINYSTLLLNQFFGQITGLADTIGGITLQETINDTVTNTTPGIFQGIHIRYILTSMGVMKIGGFWNDYGYNWLNGLGGATGIGTTNVKGSAKLDIEDTARGVKFPSMTTTQRNLIGYIKSGTITNGGTGYTVVPKGTVVSATGTGARVSLGTSASVVNSIVIVDGGSGYGGASPTLTITNGPGTGAAITLNVSGPDSGLVIYNTTIDSLQFYTGSAWIDLGGSGGGSTPTLQQVLTAGRTLTSAFTVNNGTNTYADMLSFTGPVQLAGQVLTGTYHSTNYSATLSDDIIYMNGSVDTVLLPITSLGSASSIFTIYNYGNTTTVVDAGSGNTIGANGGRYFTIAGIDQSVTVQAAGISFYAILSTNSAKGHTIFTPATGNTITVINNQENIIKPTGTIATLTIALPASPNNNDVVNFTATQIVSAITYSGGTVIGGLTSTVVGSQWHLTYDAGTTTWY